MKSEVERVIKKLKSGKTGGIKGIMNKQLKGGGNKLIDELTYLFNLYLEDKCITESWLKSKLMLIFKKRDKEAGRHTIS